MDTQTKVLTRRSNDKNLGRDIDGKTKVTKGKVKIKKRNTAA